MEDLLEYLEDVDREYFAGVALLRRYHKNKYLYTRLQKKDSAANRQKLMYELKKLAAQAPPPAHESVKVIKPKPKNKPKSQKITDKPEAKEEESHHLKILNDLSQRKARLHQMRATIANQGHEAGSDLQRKHLYKELKSIQEDYDTIAKQIELQKAGGKPNPMKAPRQKLSDLSPAELVNKRNNMRSQISRRKKILETHSPDHPKSIKAAREIKKLNDEIEQIQSLITSGN